MPTSCCALRPYLRLLDDERRRRVVVVFALALLDALARRRDAADVRRRAVERSRRERVTVDVRRALVERRRVALARFRGERRDDARLLEERLLLRVDDFFVAISFSLVNSRTTSMRLLEIEITWVCDGLCLEVRAERAPHDACAFYRSFDGPSSALRVPPL